MFCTLLKTNCLVWFQYFFSFYLTVLQLQLISADISMTAPPLIHCSDVIYINREAEYWHSSTGCHQTLKTCQVHTVNVIMQLLNMNNADSDLLPSLLLFSFIAALTMTHKLHHVAFKNLSLCVKTQLCFVIHVDMMTNSWHFNESTWKKNSLIMNKMEWKQKIDQLCGLPLL